MVECCAKNPGHLASSLGAVELIVGMHYVYDTPRDQLVFDVGHQAYAHKILTGRREAFRTMRTGGGISGFPNRDESPFDAFGVGHSSTSISAALGLAEAARLQGRHEKVVALIGDGALTGGLAFEGLNNAGGQKADLLVILNDNNQSIDRNTGALHHYLLKRHHRSTYNQVKGPIWNRWARQRSATAPALGQGPQVPGPREAGRRPLRVARLPVLRPHRRQRHRGGRGDAPQRLHGLSGPRLLHCFTVKGKGYAPAEADPTTWHAPGQFDPEPANAVKTATRRDRYQDVFGQVLCDLARQDPRVVGITPGHGRAAGCAAGPRACHPDRFFDVGIEEEHAVTFSAGLAAGGMKPFCNIYSAFSQRAYDQIIHDVALQHLPVVLCFDRAGLVGEDGATHHGAFDLAAYRSIPDVIISAPRDEVQLKHLMYTAWKHGTGPFIIRYPRGMGEGTPWRDQPFSPCRSARRSACWKATDGRPGRRPRGACRASKPPLTRNRWAYIRHPLPQAAGRGGLCALPALPGHHHRRGRIPERRPLRRRGRIHGREPGLPGLPASHGIGRLIKKD